MPNWESESAWRKNSEGDMICEVCKKYEQEEFEDTKGESESVYWRTDNTMAKEKVQKDKQRSTKHTHKTKDLVTWTPLKPGVPASLVAPVVLI